MCVQRNSTGVQRNGALTEYITMPPDKLYAAALTIKELCLVEPLTVGFHAVSRRRVRFDDPVAVIGSRSRGSGRDCGCAICGSENELNRSGSSKA